MAFSGERPPTTAAPREEDSPGGGPARIAYLDNLKLLFVAAIIAAHGLAAYSDLESAWPYQDVQEVQLGAVASGIFGMLAIPAVLFVMGVFFLMSGLVTPGSLSRKGTRRFARDRLIRLGVPLAAWTLLIWPASIWMAHVAAGDAESDRWLFTNGDPLLDTGPMWFVELLLVFSLAYAGWRHWRGREAAPRPVSGRTLLLFGAAISLATVLIRPVFPVLSGSIGQAHLWQWPQLVAMFALGIAAARGGGLDPVPDRVRRGAGLAALGGLLAFLLVAVIIAVAGLDGDVIFEPEVHWISLALAALEGPLAVGGAVWIVGTAQRYLGDASGPLRGRMVRSSYGAFLLQGVVLIALMIAMRPLDLPAEAKAPVVAALGVAGSFALSWLLVSRTPVGRVL